MEEELLATFNRVHVRLFRTRHDPAARRSHLELLDAVDLPEGGRSYFANEADQAGRFAAPLAGTSGSNIDERLPMANEHHRRIASGIARWLERALARHPTMRWQCAASPDLLRPVVDQLEPSVRQRLIREIPKNLAGHTSAEVEAHLERRD